MKIVPGDDIHGEMGVHYFSPLQPVVAQQSPFTVGPWAGGTLLGV